MVTLEPVTGAYATPATAGAVVAPPFDSLTEAQRTTLSADADSFLGALPPRIGPGVDLDAALHRCRERVDALLDAGRFTPAPRPFLGVLRLSHADGELTAVVGDVPAAAYLDGHVLPHEHVDVHRVDALARYLDVVQMASSPVAVSHRPTAAVRDAIAAVVEAEPAVHTTGADGVEVTLWVVSADTEVAALTRAVADAGTLVLADGHHRAAAVARSAGPTGRVLTAVIASDLLEVRAFHRRIDGVSEAAGALAAALAARGIEATTIPGPATPDAPGTLTVVAEGRWQRLDLRARRPGGAGAPVEQLDVALAQRELLGPLVEAAEAAGDEPEVVAVAPTLGLAALEHDGAIGVALHPTTMAEVERIAAAGQVVPPKTTYITPKLRSGLLLVPRPRP